MPAFSTEEEYREHIKGICVLTGEYEGDSQTIYRTTLDRLKWGIEHKSEQYSTSIEPYETLEEAIEDFIALNPLPRG